MNHAQQEMYCLSQEIDGLLVHIHHCEGHWAMCEPLDLTKVPKSRRETRERTYNKKKKQHEADMAELYAQLRAYQEEYHVMQERYDAAQTLLTLNH